MNDEKTSVTRERAAERADRQRFEQIQRLWRLQQEQQGASVPTTQGAGADHTEPASPTLIRVLLADDHAILRTGLRMILNAHDDIEVIGEAGDGRQAISEAQRLRPEVILMDISMPECNGIEATRQVKRLLPETRVLVLTMHENEEYLFQMLRAGASGYILKEAVDTELITAIRVVATGRFYLSPSAQSMMVGDYLQRVRSGEERDSYSALTEREREILKLVAEGHTNNQIAELLFISPKTVDTHRTHIMDKLNLHSRAELVKYAMRRGLLED